MLLRAGHTKDSRRETSRDVTLFQQAARTMLRPMTYPGTLYIKQERCVVPPKDTTLVALSLMSGVATPLGPGGMRDSTALRMMDHLLGRYELAHGLNPWHTELTGTDNRVVNYFARIHQIEQLDMFAVLDIVTANYTSQWGTSHNAAYATLTVKCGDVDDAYLALHGAHCELGQLATTWRVGTSSQRGHEDIAALRDLIGLVADVASQTSGRAFVYADHLFAGRAVRQHFAGRNGGFTPYVTRFADNTDAVWTLKPAMYGTDIDLDTAASELESTAVHRVVELDMRRDFGVDVRKDEQ